MVPSSPNTGAADRHTPAADAESLGAGMNAAVICLAGVALLFSAACTDCRDRVVQHTAGGGLNADVHERVCGSAAGFTVRVAPLGTPEEAGDAFDFEPFQSKCPPVALPTLAVSAKWLDSSHLEVRYSPALVVSRAEKRWKGVEISYVAGEPVPAGT